MNENRLAHLLESDPAAVPSFQQTPVVPSGFAVCPVALLKANWQHHLYQAAYEQARATLAPPRVRRLNLECWN